MRSDVSLARPIIPTPSYPWRSSEIRTDSESVAESRILLLQLVTYRECSSSRLERSRLLSNSSITSHLTVLELMFALRWSFHTPRCRKDNLRFHTSIRCSSIVGRPPQRHGSANPLSLSTLARLKCQFTPRHQNDSLQFV